jgi:hypothetical protein
VVVKSELFVMLICLVFSDDRVYISRFDEGNKLSKNRKWSKKFVVG